MTISSVSGVLPSTQGQRLTSLPTADAGRQRATSGEHLPNTSHTPSPSALELVEQTLAKAYEKLGLKLDTGNGGYAGFEPLTAEKVAGNILGFIERRLRMDVAEGATAEQLASRLEAGLEGFKKGFAEASDKLKALNMLSPAVAQDIGRTYDLVLDGIEQLRKSFIPSLLPETTPHPSSTVLAASASYSYAAASSFEFSLLTAEGDRIRIRAASQEQHSLGYAGIAVGGNYAVGIHASSSRSESMSWVVEGDLNEQETAAIQNLLSQINQLAGEFFRGNLDQAFERALALGYDRDQIASFSLTLTQVDVQRATTAYQALEPLPRGGVAAELQPLGSFVRHLLEGLETARAFPEAESLLLTLAREIPAADDTQTEAPGERFSRFLEQLLSGLPEQESAR